MRFCRAVALRTRLLVGIHEIVEVLKIYLDKLRRLGWNPILSILD